MSTRRIATISLLALLALTLWPAGAAAQDRTEEIAACKAECEGPKTLDCDQQCHLQSLATRGKYYLEMRDRALEAEGLVNICEGRLAEAKADSAALTSCEGERAVWKNAAERRWKPWKVATLVVGTALGAYFLGRAVQDWTDGADARPGGLLIRF